jgi:hypothetical protein
MSADRVKDAGSAQAAARRYLAAQFGSNNVKEVSFSKSWYTPGAQKDIWEVEGSRRAGSGRMRFTSSSR